MKKMIGLIILFVFIIFSVILNKGGQNIIDNDNVEGDLDITIKGVFLLDENTEAIKSDSTYSDENVLFVVYDIKNISSKNITSGKMDLLINNRYEDMSKTIYEFSSGTYINSFVKNCLYQNDLSVDIIGKSEKRYIGLFEIPKFEFESKDMKVCINMNIDKHYKYEFKISDIVRVDSPESIFKYVEENPEIYMNNVSLYTRASYIVNQIGEMSLNFRERDYNSAKNRLLLCGFMFNMKNNNENLPIDIRGEINEKNGLYFDSRLAKEHNLDIKSEINYLESDEIIELLKLFDIVTSNNFNNSDWNQFVNRVEHYRTTAQIVMDYFKK